MFFLAYVKKKLYFCGRKSQDEANSVHIRGVGGQRVAGL